MGDVTDNPLNTDLESELQRQVDKLRAENAKLREAAGVRVPTDVSQSPVDSGADEPDHNAVISEHFLELRRIGMLCANADGRPTVAFRIMQLLVLGRVVTSAGRGYAEAVLGEIFDEDGNPRPNDLHHAASGFYAFTFLMLLGPLADVTRALSTNGTLTQLGVGTMRISAADARLLRRLRNITRVGSTLSIAAGLLNLAWFLKTYTQYEGSRFNAQYFWGGLCMCAVYMFVVPTLVSGWWLSSRLASAMARDRIKSAQIAVNSTDPSNQNLWESAVVKPCLNLDEPLRLLSNGFSHGLAALMLAIFSLSFLCFVQVGKLRTAPVASFVRF